MGRDNRPARLPARNRMFTEAKSGGGDDLGLVGRSRRQLSILSPEITIPSSSPNSNRIQLRIESGERVERIGEGRMRTIRASVLLLLAGVLSTPTLAKLETSKSPAFSANVRAYVFQLIVQTGQPLQDKMVYEMAMMKFGQLFVLRESGPFDGVIDITLQTAEDSQTTGSYFVNPYAPVVSGGSSRYSWQNATMMVILKDSQGTRLWTATYQMSGKWHVPMPRTANDAAKICIEKVVEALSADLAKAPAGTAFQSQSQRAAPYVSSPTHEPTPQTAPLEPISPNKPGAVPPLPVVAPSESPSASPTTAPTGGQSGLTGFAAGAPTGAAARSEYGSANEARKPITILEERPTRAHVVLGEVEMQGRPGITFRELLYELAQKAAVWGADAICPGPNGGKSGNVWCTGYRDGLPIVSGFAIGYSDAGDGTKP